MSVKVKVFLASAIALATQSAFAALATTATVYLNSDPGSWVGGAIGAPSVTWIHGVDGVFSTSSINNGVVNIQYNDGNYWNFEFAAPTYNPVTNTISGQPLQVGLYTGAQRYPFNSPTKPGMDISGNGRGDNTLSGWFNILDISFNPSGNLSTFAVDFKQFDESSTTVGLYGSLRFNSSIAINAVPEANTWATMLVGLGLVGAVQYRRKAQTVKSDYRNNA